MITTADVSTGLQRAFRDWLDDAQPRLAVGIRIGYAGLDGIEFGFAVANPVLVGALITGGELVVAAEWEGECWDFLFCEEARPKETSTGYVCWICEAEGKHRTFPTIEALWRNHLFRPLEDWITTKLADAQAVALCRSDSGGTTWARLVRADDQADSAEFLVPLR